MKILGMLLLLTAAAFGQTTQPIRTVPDAFAAKDDWNRKLIDLTQKAAARKMSLSDSFNATPEGAKLLATMTAAEAKLEKARQTGSAQDRMGASSEFGTARVNYETARNVLFADDRELAAFATDSNQAKAEIADLERRLAAPPRWIPKPNAPPSIVAWLASQPEIREARKANINNAITAIDRAANRRGARGNPRYREELVTQLKTLDGRELVVPDLIFKVGAYGLIDRGFKVAQVVDGSNVMVEIGERRLWIKGVSTSRLTDNGTTTLKGTFHIPSTKTYGTAIGSTNTVLIAEPLNHDDWIEKVLAP